MTCTSRRSAKIGRRTAPRSGSGPSRSAATSTCALITARAPAGTGFVLLLFIVVLPVLSVGSALQQSDRSQIGPNGQKTPGDAVHHCRYRFIQVQQVAR